MKQRELSTTVRLTGVAEFANEKLMSTVIPDILSHIGINITRNDIKSAVRIGRQNTQAEGREGRQNYRPVIVTFFNPLLKRDVLVNSKKLKNINNQLYNKIYIREELTQLRWKLYYYCSKIRNISYVTTKNGYIHCYKSQENRGDHMSNVPITLANAEDLHKFGFTNIDYGELGLDEIISNGNEAVNQTNGVNNN